MVVTVFPRLSLPVARFNLDKLDFGQIRFYNSTLRKQNHCCSIDANDEELCVCIFYFSCLYDVTTTLLAVVNLTIEEHIVGVGDVGHWWQKYFIYTHSQCTASPFNNFCIHIYAHLHLMTWSHLYNTRDPHVFVSILVFVFDKLISFVLPNGPLIQTDCPCLAQPTILNRTLPKSLLFF